MDAEVAEKLEQIEQGYVRRADANAASIQRLAKRTYVVLALLVLVSFAAGALSVSLQFRFGNTAAQAAHAASQASGAASQAKSAAKEAEATAAQGRKLAARIQSNRLYLIRRQCNGQNKIHNDTVKALRHVVAISPPQPGQTAAQRQAGAKLFSLILFAQTPHQNCDVVVARAKLQP